MQGIDVSHWQKPDKFNFDNFKKKYDFLIARASYGAKKTDETYLIWKENAAERGIVFGSYHFFRQDASVDEQYLLFSNLIDVKINGLKQMYPIIDLEKNEANGDPFNADRFFTQAKELIDKITDKYNNCIIYTGAFFFEQYKEKYRWLLDYPLWVADYGYQKANNNLVHPRIKSDKEGKRNWVIWQKTDQHIDANIYDGKLDYNVLNGEVLSELIMIQKPFETFVNKQKKIKAELLEIIDRLKNLSLREELSDE